MDAERTAGTFATESEAAEYLDQLLESAADLFAVSREVDGVLLARRPGQEKIGVRIDRILYPKRKLLDAGWLSGVVGIEIKKSGRPAGPMVAQAEDYMQSAFTFSSGVSVVLNSVFLWPRFQASGIAASILAQRRIGFVGESRGRLTLTLNNTSLLHYAYDTDELCIGGAASLSCGGKVGSR
jgi:hypothetical protein